MNVAAASDVGTKGVVVHNSCRLTGGGRKKFGNLDPSLKDTKVSDAIRQRGGTASNVNKLDSDLRDLSVGDIANLAATGDDAAETALKIVKQAKRLGKRRKK